MAEKRMFAKSIVNSDAFLDMPLSSQALYFHLSMEADDEGFVGNPRRIQRLIGASEDDMKILIAKRYLLEFESGIVVVKHWYINNYIQKDRAKETTYLEERSALKLDSKNSYVERTIDDYNEPQIINKKEKPKQISEARQKRRDARMESDLPFSFDYKIRRAFVGRRCPICNCVMGNEYENVKPTIQHNVPISLGGKHEIGNISVICKSCNTSIQNRHITGDLNNNEVIQVWNEIIGNEPTETDDEKSGLDTNYSRIGYTEENRIEENRIEEISDVYNNNTHTQDAPFDFLNEIPTLQEIKDFITLKDYPINPDEFYDYYTARGWKLNNQPIADWRALASQWARKTGIMGRLQTDAQTRIDQRKQQPINQRENTYKFGQDEITDDEI